MLIPLTNAAKTRNPISYVYRYAVLYFLDSIHVRVPDKIVFLSNPLILDELLCWTRPNPMVNRCILHSVFYI